MTKQPFLLRLVGRADWSRMVDRAGEQVQALILTQMVPGKALSGGRGAALQMGMVKAALAYRLVSKGTTIREAADLVGWDPKLLARTLRRAASGKLGTLEPLAQSELDVVMLAVAPLFRVRPGVGFTRLYREYGHLISNQTRLMDALMDNLLRPADLTDDGKKRKPPSFSEGQIRVLLHCAGRSLVKRITIREAARGHLRAQIDRGRVGFMDAIQIPARNGKRWLVALRVGDKGITVVVDGPESGVAAQRALILFLRKYERTFDILVVDCALAYRELSFRTLLLQMGIQVYPTEFVVDNWIEREFGGARRRMLRSPHLTKDEVLPRFRRQLRLLSKAEIERLRRLNFAQLGLIRYDRCVQATVESGGADVQSYCFPLELPDGEQLTAGCRYQYPDQPAKPQRVEVDFLRCPVETVPDDEGDRLGHGTTELEVVGAFRIWINGARRLERAPEPVICVVPVDPKPIGGDGLIESIGGGSGPGDGEMNPTVAPPPTAGTGDKKKPKSKAKRRRAAVWRSPDGEFILIRIPARGDLPAIVRELGLDLRQVELARAYWPALSELRFLANNPDYAPACQAIGTLSRRVPLLLAVSRTVLPYSTFEALVLDGELIYSGDPRRSKAGETKLPVSFDAVFELVDRAGQCRSAEERRAMESALRCLREIPVRKGTRAARERRDMEGRLLGAVAACGRGEWAVAAAILSAFR
jgi:hypothetical protein